MTEKSLTANACGPSTLKCKCECANEGPCDHEWGGEMKEIEPGMYTTVCTRCGMAAIDHSLWVSP